MALSQRRSFWDKNPARRHLLPESLHQAQADRLLTDRGTMHAGATVPADHWSGLVPIQRWHDDWAISDSRVPAGRPPADFTCRRPPNGYRRWAIGQNHKPLRRSAFAGKNQRDGQVRRSIRNLSFAVGMGQSPDQPSPRPLRPNAGIQSHRRARAERLAGSDVEKMAVY